MYREKGTLTKPRSLQCDTPQIKVTEKSEATAITRLVQYQRATPSWDGAGSMFKARSL